MRGHALNNSSLILHGTADKVVARQCAVVARRFKSKNGGVVREESSNENLENLFTLDCVLFTKFTHHVFQMAEKLKTMLVFQSQFVIGRRRK